MLQTGTCIKDITPDVSGITMMGWGNFKNKAFGVGMPLKCRSFVFHNPESNKKVVFSCAEIAFITIALKQGVINYLNQKGLTEFNHENIMLSATHTHSAPGGFSHYMMYNLNSYGFINKVFDTYVINIAESIIEANNNLKDSRLFFNQGEISPEKNVAFNRSVSSYNLNPDVQKVTKEQANIAIDRTMSLLKIDSAEKIPMGVINWFAVHCTNVHSDNYLIHPDNKGYAATNFEKIIKNKEGSDNFVSAFAQSSCGDVTPNFKKFKDVPFCRGEFEDDFKSAEFNGLIQSEQAQKLFYSEDKKELNTELDYIHTYIDFSNVKIDPEFCNGETNAKTASASIGVVMLTGTEEGPGIDNFLRRTVELASKSFTQKYFMSLSEQQKIAFKEKIKSQGNKIIFADMGEGRILNINDLSKLPIPEYIDEVVKLLKNMAKNDAIGDKPWTPNILPIQIFIIGQLAILSVPSEFTTISAKRLKATVLNILKNRGITDIVLSGYSNAYSGYVTTREEYQAQAYEGGSTHFGQWTLAAYQTVFKRLALEFIKPENERVLDNSVQPHKFSEEEIKKRSFIEV